MKTAVKKNRTLKPAERKTAAKKPATKTQPAAQPQADKIEYIAIAQTDLSPLNYRRFFDPTDLQNFAEELRQHGIIHALLMRPRPSGRYEIVVGERRYRSAQLAGMQYLPATIKDLTDQQVIELQLAENMQRENPHSLHEAQGILQMQKLGMSIDSIATRLGKTKAFIFARIRLTELIESLQEIFVRGKFGLHDAFEIASLAKESQQELYEEHFKDWEKKEFRLYNLFGLLNKFRYDLKRAPFDVKDKTLVPEMGACSKCPFNTATMKTLFPELAKEATCTNKGCYKQKCTIQISASINEAISMHQPAALLTWGSFSETMRTVIESHPIAKDLPVYDRYSVNFFNAPEAPDKEDYKESDSEEESEPIFDEEGYAAAMEEYQSDLQEYNDMQQSGTLVVGLLISETEIKPVLFKAGSQNASTQGGTATAKAVQQAIKNGTVTTELLQGEIERLQSREHRAKALDRDKVQVKIQEEFSKQFNVLENNLSLNHADMVAARLIIYDGLDYHTRRVVQAKLLAQYPQQQDGEWGHQYEMLSSLTEQEFAYLIRMAVASKAESKMPSTYTGYALYEQAKDAGVDVQQVELQQQEKVKAREEKLQLRLADMQITARHRVLNTKSAGRWLRFFLLSVIKKA